MSVAKPVEGTGVGSSNTTNGLDLNATHPSYDIFEPWYDEMEDALEGESAIEDAQETYLPMPGGMALMPDSATAYAAYQKRASYPEIVSPTVRGLSGIIHNEPVKFELPKVLEPMLQIATTDNLTLESAIRRITRNILSYGRTGIAVSVNPAGIPLLAIYTAKAIRNWAEDETLVVLDESGPEMQENLTWVDRTRRLLIEIIDGNAIATRYDNTNGWSVIDEPIVYSKRGEQAVGTLPFVFIDTNDLTPEPDEVPLLALARLAAKAYRQDANYQQTLYLSANPTHVITGMDPKDENVPRAVGGGIIWIIPQPDATASILEFTGASALAQRQAIQDTFQQAIQAGAKLFATADEQQESGEARKIKYAAQTATLVGVALTSAAGLEKALRICAVMQGSNPDEVRVPISTDFIDSTIGAQEMTAILSSVVGGLLSEQTGYELYQEGGRANPDRTWEDEKKLIDEQEPGLGMLGRESVKPVIPEETERTE